MRYHINKLSTDGDTITQRKDFSTLLMHLIHDLLASQAGYDELIRPVVAEIIFPALSQEMDQFASTVAKGEQLLDGYFATPGKTMLTGDEVFKMYDTFGLPMELTKEVAAHH